MSPSERDSVLVQWIKPSSDNEKVQQERAIHMVTEAINSRDAFEDSDIEIYAKGSYRNRTNVRLDSDVDISVELKDCMYYEYFRDVDTSQAPTATPYSGGWTPDKWRAEVIAALEEYFGSSSVDTTGKIAINIPAVAGSRPSIDIVPSFDFTRYDDAAQTPSRASNGSCVFPKGSYTKTVNWPQQQYDNGVLKNDNTGRRYKRFVRALKNSENVLVKAGLIEPLASYLMECLIYNVDNYYFNVTTDDLEQSFGRVLLALRERLKLDETEPMVEPNELKYLFRGDKKWTIKDAIGLVDNTLSFMGYLN